MIVELSGVYALECVHRDLHGKRLTEPLHVQMVCCWLYGRVGPPRWVQLGTWQRQIGIFFSFKPTFCCLVSVLHLVWSRPGCAGVVPVRCTTVGLLLLLPVAHRHQLQRMLKHSAHDQANLENAVTHFPYFSVFGITSGNWKIIQVLPATCICSMVSMSRVSVYYECERKW
jgi:hypothetical protein